MIRALSLLMAALLAAHAHAWDDRRLGAPVVVDGRTVSFPEFAIYVMPEQRISVHFRDALSGGTVEFAGRSVAVGERPLRAPDAPGLYPLTITNRASGEIATIHVFVMTPAARMNSRGYLNGYRIGAYPRQPLKGLDIYRAPQGYVEVTEANQETRLSPNFRLAQFVTKQPGGFPKYVVLRANLLLKLESILAQLNASGRATGGFVIMSGYRTPWYNRSIGNVPGSRHVWGGAADIFIDEHPRDGVMDDLNGDGVIDRQDAQWLASFIEEMSRQGLFEQRVGGLGVYGSTSAHGPFVHVDVRGTRARW
jgi:hypothetical protein